MTETKTAVTAATAAKASPKPRKKTEKPASKKTAKSSGTRKGLPKRKSVSLEEARQELVQKVCGYSGAITDVLIQEALEGKQLCAKFLFEAVGLCEIRGDELEEAGERESLAGMLLKQWQLPAQPAVPADTDGNPVTEVSQPVPDLAPVEQAPVES
jgi:hypothetical protein